MRSIFICFSCFYRRVRTFLQNFISVVIIKLSPVAERKYCSTRINFKKTEIIISIILVGTKCCLQKIQKRWARQIPLVIIKLYRIDKAKHKIKTIGKDHSFSFVVWNKMLENQSRKTGTVKYYTEEIPEFVLTASKTTEKFI